MAAVLAGFVTERAIVLLPEDTLWACRLTPAGFPEAVVVRLDAFWREREPPLPRLQWSCMVSRLDERSGVWCEAQAEEMVEHVCRALWRQVGVG